MAIPWQCFGDTIYFHEERSCITLALTVIFVIVTFKYVYFPPIISLKLDNVYIARQITLHYSEFKTTVLLSLSLKTGTIRGICRSTL